MPLYHLHCADCEHTFEKLVTKMSAEASGECPKCGSEKLERAGDVPAAVSSTSSGPQTNCRGDGPPCGAAWCGKK